MYVRVKEIKELERVIDEYEHLTGKSLTNLTKLVQRLWQQRERGNEWQRNYTKERKLRGK